MNTWIDFLPLLALVFVIGWVARVHRQCLRRLREAYRSFAIPFPAPRGIAAFNAWAIFQRHEADTLEILKVKEALQLEAKQRLRLSGVIFFAAFFGLAVLSTILKPVLR
ncbi:MAG TPA: hypothetical protein VF593_13030 [Chthoniobacteraceae bacterium]|jgi:hypothetical protein